LSQHAANQDSPTSASFAVDMDNSNPGNDSAAFGSPVFNSQSDSSVPAGYECQAQIVDFAPTIEGLQVVPTPDATGAEADARFLDEAFAKCLGNNVDQPSGPVCGNLQSLDKAKAPPPPPPPPPIIYAPRPVIIIPPPKPKPYGFHGLVRHVQAQVVDQKNDTVPFALPGTYLSSVRITADFGKPNSEVTITLYRRNGASSAQGGRVNLKAIARFCPFTVKRNPDVQLRFQVPSAYQSDHVGLTVRQVHMLKSATGPACPGTTKKNAFIGFGPEKGALVPVLDAPLLHHLKPCPASLTIPVPHGAGISSPAITIYQGSQLVRSLPSSQLGGSQVVIPASQLPGGSLTIRVQWLKLGRRKTLTLSYTRSFYNCTLAQRRKLGQR
jgi:hypothetical protein